MPNPLAGARYAITISLLLTISCGRVSAKYKRTSKSSLVYSREAGEARRMTAFLLNISHIVTVLASSHFTYIVFIRRYSTLHLAVLVGR